MSGEWSGAMRTTDSATAYQCRRGEDRTTDTREEEEEAEREEEDCAGTTEETTTGKKLAGT